MRVLVIGRDGQLSQSLAEHARRQPGLDFQAIGRPQLDLERPDAVVDQIGACRPDVVINAAAYTAVDKAESEPEKAFAINRDGAAAVARAAASVNAGFIHISTDYVFDGRKTEPYVEQDATGPLNIYGRSKLEGEHAVLAAHPRALVLRTSWVFSPFGSNFVKTMLRVGAERPLLRVVNDQIGNPTSAPDLASAILGVAPRLRDQPGGLYHISGFGSTSWYEFAEFIFSESRKNGGPSPALEAIPSSEYKTPAQRPANSRLNCDAFAARFGITLRPWREAVSETITRCL